jgi:RNA polymerase sigma-70 factor (ECF subfamily)
LMGGFAAEGARWNDALGMGASPTSFEDLFHAERDRLFRMLVVITGSRQEAEDISQDAFARVWERWASVSRMANPAGYLHRTAMNVFRSKYRRALLAARRTAGTALADDVYETVDDRQVALQILRAMPPRQRAAIVLTEVLGYSATDASKMLGVRASTVRALHFQARSALKTIRERIDG